MKKKRGKFFIIILAIVLSSIFNPGLHGSEFECKQKVRKTASVARLLMADNELLSIQKNPFRYSGYYCDCESGIFYLKARYYSPLLMRFISRDTYDLSNRYAYCEGNPVGMKDSTGHSPWFVDMLIPHDGLQWGILAGAVVLSGVLGATLGFFYATHPLLAVGAEGAFIGGGSQLVSNAATGNKLTDGVAVGALAGGALALSCCLLSAKCKNIKDNSVGEEPFITPAETTKSPEPVVAVSTDPIDYTVVAESDKFDIYMAIKDYEIAGRRTI